MLFTALLMNTWPKRLEIAVNIAILCAFLMVAALAGQRFWHARSADKISGPEIGAKVSLAGVDWSKSGRTLVLALSTTCHFCSESAEFYKRLIPEAISHGVPVVAALPQSPAEGRSYLDELGLHVQNVLQAPLSAVDAAGTPTLLFVDRSGKISKAWVGKLAPQQESQVLASLQ
jgi:hypothetical protein